MKPRKIFWDLETAPMRGWFWDLFETNPLEVQDHWYLLSYGFKYEGEKRVTVKALPDFRSRKNGVWDDRQLVLSLHKLLSQPNVILVGHNADKFDLKKANARFVFHGLTPIPPHKTLDTLKIARRHFKFDSNRLDFIGQYLGVGRKIPNTGKHLWFACMRGDKKAWALMKKYNAQDVVLLEKVYKKLSPWIQNHPYVGEDCHCGNGHLVRRGFHPTKRGRVPRLQCTSCGAWSLGKLEKNEK